MLRLQMYLPNALRKEVFDFLPSPPPFSWFFFGKKVFDPDLEKVCLEVKRPAQFYCATSGVSYEVSEPSRRILITREGENEEKAREVCRRGELAGYASGPRAVPVSMEPPLPGEVVFWIFPEAVSPVRDWKKCNVLQYASRVPENSWIKVGELVERVGINEASRLCMADKVDRIQNRKNKKRIRRRPKTVKKFKRLY